ncbi:MAG: VOC family protein [Myxococcota bacterium]
MSVQQLTPYLFFDGTADRALELYAQALDAKVEGLLRYEEMPEGVDTCPPEDKKRVMHALVHVGEARLMVSDVPSSRPEPAGGNVQIVVDFDDADEMARKFHALAASGTVHMALHDAFWGAKFGMLQDEFGIHWMFSCANESR